MSAKFLPAILKTLEDSLAAWWEIDGALFALGRAEPADIRAQMPRIDRFSSHEEWYLREASFWAIVGLHETITGEEFNKLTEIYGRSRHVFARASYDGGFRTILKLDKVALDRVSRSRAIATLGRTTYDVPVAFGYGTGGTHEAAHRTMMILEHFDPEVFRWMVDDFAKYLEIWEPYYQHSVWLISGSKWQPGILAVLGDMGSEGRPICVRLKAILASYGEFDEARIGAAGKDLEGKIREALDAWEARNGKIE